MNQLTTILNFVMTGFLTRFEMFIG